MVDVDVNLIVDLNDPDVQGYRRDSISPDKMISRSRHLLIQTSGTIWLKKYPAIDGAVGKRSG